MEIIDNCTLLRKIMYYRITKATVKPEAFDDAMTTMESLRKSIGEINGLVSSILIRTSENELLAVAAYHSKADLESSEIKFRELMMDMMPYMAGTPQITFGEGVFSFNS